MLALPAHLIKTGSRNCDQIQWLGQTSFRLRIKTPAKTFILYIDPDIQNPMLPHSIRTTFIRQEVPTDADFVLCTSNIGQNLANALTLCLAAEGRECRIICAPSTAETLLATKMISANMLSVISSRGDVSIGIARITMVHANYFTNDVRASLIA